MSACRLQASNPSSPEHQVDLDDYYLLADAMGERHDAGRSPGTPGEDDVYAQLAQKERDLTLAAELGKALLERNEEMEKRHEQIIEEYSQKLEELEQEKYELHLKLEKTEAEYENTIKELQFDISQLRHELQSQQHQSSADDKERSDIIRELSQSNERLREDVRMAGAREDDLVSEVQSLKEHMTSRRSSMYVHINQLELLQEEINLLTQRKLELERRIASLLEERETLNCNIEETQEKIMVLERQNKEKDQQLQNQQRDMVELQEANIQLQAQIHHMSSHMITPDHRGNNQSKNLFHEMSGMTTASHQENYKAESLFSELSRMSSSSHDSNQSPSLLHELSAFSSPASSHHGDSQPQSLFNELSHMSSHVPQESLISQFSEGDDVFTHHHHQMSLAEMMEEEDYECDDDDVSTDYEASALPLNSTMLSDSQFLSHFQNSPIVMETDNELQEELVHVYKQLQQMCTDLGSDSPKGQRSSLGEEDIRPGKLSNLMQELRQLMQDMISPKTMTSAESQANLADEDIFSVSELQKHIKELQSELSGAQSDLDRVKSELSERDVQLKEKSKELSQLTNKLTLQHEELLRLQTERDKLQSLSGAQSSRDEVVEKARRDRDNAIEKQNKMEIELTRTKLDVMNLNSQLMEAIQQKVTLSQQLDQWQVDMEELLELQMRKRIKEQTSKEEVEDKLEKALQMRKSKSTSFV